MKITVDGIIFQLQKYGGVSRIYHEALPKMCELDDKLFFNIITVGRCRQRLPVHPHITQLSLFPVDDILRPHTLWWPILLKARELTKRLGMRGLDGEIWHSTYYTKLTSWKKQSVVTVFDMIHERFPEYSYKRQYERFKAQKEGCIKSADAIICISETTKRDLLNYYRPDESKIRVIPLAASQHFREINGKQDPLLAKLGKPFIIYIGARTLYKNFLELVKAYSAWPHRKEIDLVVVGAEWSREEQQLLRDNGILDRVILFEALDDYSLSCLYSQALAFVYPSLYEGFGIPLLEAMACGCPVIASRIPSTMEIVGEAAIYFDIGHTRQLIDALNIAWREGRQSERSKNGRAIVNRYSWENTARMTLELYKQLIG